MKSSSRKETGDIKQEGDRMIRILLPMKREMFWDMCSFRPDISEKLGNGNSYKADIFFDEENLPSGKLIIFPRRIVVNGESFINVR